MRERIDADDLRLWHDAALALRPLTGGRLSRERILKDLAQRAKALRVREPGGRGDGFGALDFDDVVSPTMTAVHEHGPWLFAEGGNRFTGAGYSVGGADGVRVYELCGRTVARRASDGPMGRWTFTNATLLDIPDDLLVEMLDLFFDVVLPLSIAANTVRSAVRELLVPFPLPARVREKLKDAFKRDDALIRDALAPALWSRAALGHLEDDILAALELFSVGDADEASTSDEAGVEATSETDTALGRITLHFANHVLTTLDRLGSLPGLSDAERASAAILKDAVLDRSPRARAAGARLAAGGGDAMGERSWFGMHRGRGPDGQWGDDQWGDVDDYEATYSVTGGSGTAVPGSRRARTASDPTQRDLSHDLVEAPVIAAAADADEVNALGYGPLVFLQRAVGYLDDPQSTYVRAARHVLETALAAEGLPFEVDAAAKIAEEAGIDRTGRPGLARRDSVAARWRDHADWLLHRDDGQDEWGAFTQDEVDDVVDLTVQALMKAANAAYDDFTETLKARRAEGSYLAPGEPSP